MFTLSMLIAHTLADFVIQTGNTVKAKADMKIKGYLLHGATLLLTSLPFMLLLNLRSMSAVLLKVSIIIAAHLVIDFLKQKLQNYLQTKTAPKISNLLLFVSDQAIHILIILFVTSGSSIEYNQLGGWFISVNFADNGLTYENLKRIFLVLYISFSGAYFIPLMLDKVYEKVDRYTDILNEILKVGENPIAHGFIDEVKAGKWIGILERILIVIFLYSNQFASIGFIIAVKSLARFKMLENKIFSEYYLMGTMISVVYTFIVYGFLEKII